MLDPPYPNPTSEQLLFRYAAKYDGQVSLDVYDVRGRRVDHIADHSRGDGVIRAVVWSARNLPSGVYFALLRAGEERKARRIVITK